jgi:hypothetical protein
MSSRARTAKLPASPRPGLAAAGLILLAITSLAPLLLERLPIQFLAPPSAASARLATRLAVLAVLVGMVALRAWWDRSDQDPATIALALAGLATVMTLVHWYFIDRAPDRSAWQQELYLAILNHRADAPHVYRPLPYGFARTLERLTGDERLSAVAYRWFFSYWFVWCYYRFARLFTPPARALATLAVLLPLYPLSIAFYWGQLTDPLSHALFVLALIYAVEDRSWLLAATLGLGVLAKETIALMVPAYWACYRNRGWSALGKTMGLGAACLAAFLAVRLPLGWKPGLSDINGTTGLMVSTNLGIGQPLYLSEVPSYQNYLQPLLFVGVFLPFIVWHWRNIDGRLKALFLTLVPLLLLSSLCFSWMYESRNCLPLLPLLTTMAFCQRNP